MKRRTFIRTSATAAALSLINAGTLQGALQKESKPVRIGFIGCGGRGTGVISTMSKNTNLHIVALADLLQDRLDGVLPTINRLNGDKNYSPVNKKNIYVGENAYKQLLQNKEIDAVLISTTAYAHPFIFEAAVAAGKHVYCEKPSAPDVFGTLQMLNAAKGIKHLSLVCGYQIRYATPFVEMVKRIHSGAIGDIVTVQLFYNSSEVPQLVKENISDDEFRLRNHFHFVALSGGILNDQAIHMLDVCNWVLGTQPLCAIGMGNKKGGMNFGDTLTNYQVVYQYPDDINVSLQSYQMGPEFGDVCARFVGTKGFAESHYSGGVFIKGANEWSAGTDSSLYDADPNKGKSFINSIETGNYLNQIESGCYSTLTALLGREAAFTGKKVLWNELLAANPKLNPDLNLSLFH